MARKVAVVAVHGVADQEPFESARQIATLLADSNSSAYAAFRETQLRVPLTPAMQPSEAPRRSWLVCAFQLQDRPRFMRTRGKPIDPGYEFTRDQLRYYEPDSQARTFDTICLQSTRADGTDVDVYEAYWADLSRVGSGIRAFFGELYQLLLHLPSLGRIAVETAAMEYDRWFWNLYAALQRWVVRTLTVFIVALHLVLLSFVLPLLSGWLIAHMRPIIYLPPAIAALIIAFALIWRSRRPAMFVWLFAAPMAFIAAIAFSHSLIVAMGRPSFIALQAWIVSTVAIIFVAAIYNRRRPGALGYVLFASAVAGLALGWRLFGSSDDVPQATLHAAEIIDVLLQLAWWIHVLLLLLVAIAGILTALFTRRVEAWRTAWTGRFGVSFATALYALFTISTWAALFNGVARLLPDEQYFPFLPFCGDMPRFAALTALKNIALALLGRAWTNCGSSINGWVSYAVVESAETIFVMITGAVAVFAVLAVWSIAPSVIVEIRPPKDAQRRDRIEALGIWLTRGFFLIPVASEVFTLLFLAAVVAVLRYPHELDHAGKALLSAAAGAFLFLLAARLWLPGASAALDVLLDVDNHLRQSPRNRTPRAQIAERYASLLRHVIEQKYDEVVVIAHSQGGVITADLLRFLKLQRDDISRQLRGKITLFTMGCPLLKLYARAFPHLYDWVRPRGPRPLSLGVKRWVNAYRSGDYVGRWIWEGPRFDKARWNTAEVTVGRRTQVCIGEGAHTHYWDYAGQTIGRMLNQLI